MIEFNDLKPVHIGLASEIQAALRRVLARAWYVLGPEVETFEQAFARYHGVRHAVGVANGTDAIELALRAAGIGPGDEVITVAHTAVATVCAVERAGATPVLVDVDPETYTMCPAASEAAVSPRTRALLPVHLYGHPADLTALTDLARRKGLALIEDCAQAHGAVHAGRRVGTVGQLGTFSFYPTKNLGACGDGGAVITNDDALAVRLRRLRNYGQENRYHHIERGVNSRLDEMQAAVLSVKLAHLDAHTAERRNLASLYCQHIQGVQLPTVREGSDAVSHVYHLFVVRHPRRDWLRAELTARGVGTLIHYPIPVHLQPAYADLGYRRGSLPQTEAAAAEVLSLPLFVGMPSTAVAAVARAVADATSAEGRESSNVAA